MTSEPIIGSLKTGSNHTSKPELINRKEASIQGMSLEARHLISRNHKGEVLLNDISLSIRPGELVILAGADGSGASTLIRAMAGLQHITGGEVLLNGNKLAENYKSLRARIGFVPQDDIVHQDLTVSEALDFASRLRLPGGTTPGERKKRIEIVMDEMGLGAMRATRIRDLDAGLKKCINIAVELITDPGILYIENPFPGLDIQAAKRLLNRLRWITNQGLPVILTTHSAEFLGQADRLGLLSRDRSLAWFGPPVEALDYFAPYRKESGQSDTAFGLSDVYDLFENPDLGSAQDWASRYLDSPASQKYAAGGSKGKKPELALDERPLAKKQPGLADQKISKPASAFSQWLMLSRRSLKLLLRDRVGLVLMLAVPLLLACIDFVFSSRKMYDITLGDPGRISTASALLIFLAMALGSILWINEFHKEAAVYQREHQVALKIVPYVLSKVWIAGLVALYQGLVWVVVHFLAAAMPLRTSILVNFYAFLVLAIFIGGLFGLLASFVMSSEKRSLVLLSIFLVPQLIFSGAFLPFSKFNPVISAMASVIPSHFVFQGLSTSDGHGKVLASDSCWQLPAEQRQNLSDQQKQSLCSCMGVNIFRLCNFPGILRFYNQSLDQPAPVMPASSEAYKFPNPPSPAPGDTLDQYAQKVKDSFATTIEANLATSGIYQNQISQYMNDLTAWESARKAAVSKAESQLEIEYDDFAPDYNANLAFLYLGLVGESMLLVLLLFASVKRKDFRRNEPY